MSGPDALFEPPQTPAIDTAEVKLPERNVNAFMSWTSSGPKFHCRSNCAVISAEEVAPAVCPVKVPCRMTVPVPALGVALSLGGTLGGTLGGDDDVGGGLPLGGRVAGCDGGGCVGADVVHAAARSRTAPAMAMARELMSLLVGARRDPKYVEPRHRPSPG